MAHVASSRPDQQLLAVAVAVALAAALLAAPAHSAEPAKQAHTYWLEIASRGEGAFGSEWRTLAVARNRGADQASVTFVLHTASGDVELARTIPAGGQGVFDDVVGAMGLDAVGALELRSSQPLDVVGRIYNQAADGTFGQLLDGYGADGGLDQGESAWLLGLRQATDEYRSNLSVTNTGSVPATVRVTLFDTDGAQLLDYILSPGPGQVVQDTEPFRRRANRPELGFGFARVAVVAGSGILSSASVVDSRTNDATTILMKRDQPATGCPPGPADLVLVAATGEGELTAAWTPAVDDTTAPAAMIYHVHLGSSAGFQPGPGTLAATVVGSAEAVLQGLDPATAYHVVVLAEDGDGNLSRPGQPWAATTLELMPVQKPGAVVQTAAALGLGEATASGATLIFQKQAGATLPTVGAVLIGPLAGGGGYLRTVASVSQTATEIRVATTAAAVEDGYQQFQLRSSGAVPDVDGGAKAWAGRWGGEAGALPPGMSVGHETRADGSRVGRIAWPDRLVTVETVRHAGRVGALEYRPSAAPNGVEARVTTSDLGEITLEAGVDFYPELVTDATWSWTGVQTAEVVARGELDLHALASYEWTAAAEYEETIPIFTTSWVAVYSVGPVPVYQKITLSLDAELSASASAAVSAEAAASASAVVEVGARYTQAGGWQPVSSLEFSRSLSADLSVVGGVEAEVRLVPRLEVEFYEAIAAWITVEPSLAGEIAAEGTLAAGCGLIQLTAFDFELGVEAKVGVDFTLFGSYTLFDATVWDPAPWPLFSLPEATLASSGSGPVTLVATVEDGVGNPFDNSSVDWRVSPATATVAAQAGDPRRASLTCTQSGQYTVTFSGHGRLGELGRRCVERQVSCTPDQPQPPQTAPALTATAASASQVNLSWTAVSGATGYRLYRAGDQVYAGAGRTFNDTGLSANTQYCYTVRAYNAAGDGPLSSQACATTSASAPTTAPTLTATASSASQVNLSWTAVSGATGYRLYRGGSQVYAGTARTYNDTGLSANTQYCYTVRAYNAAGDGPLSSQACATTQGGQSVGLALTSGDYSETDDLDAACRTEFGSSASLADWTDVVDAYNVFGTAFADEIGLTGNRKDALTQRNGQRWYSSTRHYFLTRHDGVLPSYYLSHDNVGDHFIDLGSWYGMRQPILCRTEGGGSASDEITVTLPGGVPLVLVKIPHGTFMMGSDAPHQVTLTRDYYIGKYEVTQRQWQAVMGSTVSFFTPCGLDCPVEQESWNDICGGATGSSCTSTSFIGRLNAHLGTTAFRLPTEAEWERAARAGTTTEFSFPVPVGWDKRCGSLPEALPYMWWCNNAGDTTHQVGTKQANPYGLYDMHGNVLEWVGDWYGSYPSTPVTDPTGPSSGSFRVTRGGSWFTFAMYCSSAYRSHVSPSLANKYTGFRLARS